MSERDDNVLLRIALVVLAVMVTLATVMNVVDSIEVRDLQRRVGQLESERR